MTRRTNNRPTAGGGRMRRVDEAIKQVLSTTIPTLKDPRIGFVTVTAVDTTTDLEHALVWLSVYGTEKQQQATLEALESATGVLQARVNKELHMRRTPQLRFTYDAAIERGVRMSALIDELAPPELERAAESGEEHPGDEH